MGLFRRAASRASWPVLARRVGGKLGYILWGYQGQESQWHKSATQLLQYSMPRALLRTLTVESCFVYPEFRNSRSRCRENPISFARPQMSHATSPPGSRPGAGLWTGMLISTPKTQRAHYRNNTSQYIARPFKIRSIPHSRLKLRMTYWLLIVAPTFR